MSYSSEGCVGVKPVKAISPLWPTKASIQKSHEGLISQRGSFLAAPASGCSHSEVCVPSWPPTSSELPSGIQSTRKRSWSMDREASEPSPPVVGGPQISFSLFGSPSRGYQ